MRLPSRRVIASAYLASGILAGAVSFAFGQSKNLEIFRHAARAVLAGRDLYDGSSLDWFKYSPAFALAFVPLAAVPAWIAAVLWGALNFGVAFAGIEAAALGDDRRARVAALAALPGILLATDGDQSNLLVGGSMLLAFAAFERGRSRAGAAAVAVAVLIKIFPLAAGLFALPHADRERSLRWIAVALGVGLVLPLAVMGPRTLAMEYASWLALLQSDFAHRGWSLVTVLPGPSSPVAAQLAGLVILVAPIAGAIGVPVDAAYRRLGAAAALVFVVLFNHRAEYATFVVSAMGVALWFAEGPATAPRVALLALASVAHGPFFAHDDPSVTGALSFLGAHRLFHPARIVPIAVIWVALEVSLVRRLVAALDFARAQREGRRA